MEPGGFPSSTSPFPVCLCFYLIAFLVYIMKIIMNSLRVDGGKKMATQKHYKNLEESKLELTSEDV